MGSGRKSPYDATVDHATQVRRRASSVEVDVSGTTIRGFDAKGSAYRRFGRDRDQRSTCCYVRLGGRLAGQIGGGEAGFESGYFHCLRVTQAWWDGIWILQRYGRGSHLHACTASTLLSGRSQPFSPTLRLDHDNAVPSRLLRQRLGFAPNAARITSAVFSAASGARGCPHTTARMKSGPTSRS